MKEKIHCQSFGMPMGQKVKNIARFAIKMESLLNQPLLLSK